MEELNTMPVVASGQRGEMPGHVVPNATLDVATTDALDVHALAKNLADRTYVDMTRGLIPGKPGVWCRWGPRRRFAASER